MELTERLRWEASLTVGSRVAVRWGHGEAVRMRGVGLVTKLNEKSVRVCVESCEEAYHTVGGVRLPAACGEPGTEVFVGTAVRVARLTNPNWDEHANSVWPVEEN